MRAAFGSGARKPLIVLQVALSFILLLGTGLLARSLLTLETQNLGYDRQNILIVHTDPHLAGYQKEGTVSALPRHRRAPESNSRCTFRKLGKVHTRERQ